MVKNEKGFIILDDYKKLEHFTMGRKEKQWLEIDGEKYLFKTGYSNYEIFSELISEEIGKQLELEMAHYELAILDGKIGVLTPNFLKGFDIIINGKRVLEIANFIIEENNLESEIPLKNCVSDVLCAINLFTNGNYNRNMFEELVNRWVFDGIIMESDRNSTNWSLIQSKTSFRLSPIYDTSTMAMLNNNIDDLLLDIKRNGVYKYTDEIENQFTFHRNEKNNEFLESFANFCRDYVGQATRVMKMLNNLNVYNAIDKVEKRIQEGAKNPIEIPYNLKFWVNKLIESRYLDMINIYNKQCNILKTDSKKL